MKSEVILELVRTLAPITAIMGEGQNLRLYPQRAPQGEPEPYGTFKRINTTPTNRFDSPSRHDYASYDFHLYSHDKEALDNLVKIFRESLEGSSGTFAGVEINHVEYMSDSDEYIETTETHTHQIEFNFNYKR
jgi:hypothetical protein